MKLRTLVFAACTIVSAVILTSGQNLDFERDRHKSILNLIRDDVKKNYYDTTFKGTDIEARYKAAAEKLAKATSVGQLSGIVAQFLIDFDDSHLFYIPPGKVNKTSYGFDFRMIGIKCYVLHVKKGSDAEKKGLQVGDELYSIDGFQPSREILWKMQYYYYSLRPKPGLNLVVVKPDGKSVDLAIASKITPGKRVKDLTGESDDGQDMFDYERESESADKKTSRQYLYDKLDGACIWKMPGFALDPSKVDDIMARVRKYPALILDLRGNGGGRVDMLQRLVANIFPEDIKVFDEKGRKETKEIIARSRGKDAYTGKIVVLIDSGSASASEIFSRVVQIEKRGQVIGDVSAGAVMESRFFDHDLGMDTVVFFGASVTIADVIMKDGKSLEKVGVRPDITLVPSGKELAAKRDSVLAYALGTLGVDITPEAAGSIFPDDATNDQN